MKFIIVDWMYNVCFDSDNQEFKSFDEAEEFLCRWLGEDYEEERGELEILEYDESIDRLMWTGTRYVLKKDYYKEAI